MTLTLNNIHYTHDYMSIIIIIIKLFGYGSSMIAAEMEVMQKGEVNF